MCACKKNDKYQVCREARQTNNDATANPWNRVRNPEIGGQEEFAGSKR